MVESEQELQQRQRRLVLQCAPSSLLLHEGWSQQQRDALSAPSLSSPRPPPPPSQAAAAPEAVAAAASCNGQRGVEERKHQQAAVASSSAPRLVRLSHNGMTHAVLLSKVRTWCGNMLWRRARPGRHHIPSIIQDS